MTARITAAWSGSLLLALLACTQARPEGSAACLKYEPALVELDGTVALVTLPQFEYS